RLSLSLRRLQNRLSALPGCNDSVAKVANLPGPSLGLSVATYFCGRRRKVEAARGGHIPQGSRRASSSRGSAVTTPAAEPPLMFVTELRADGPGSKPGSCRPARSDTSRRSRVRHE